MSRNYQARVETALSALDRALEDRPDHVYSDLVEAVAGVTAIRDALIAERRAGGGTEMERRLARCNAVLSLVVGGEYPLQGVRRDRVQQARDELASFCG